MHSDRTTYLMFRKGVKAWKLNGISQRIDTLDMKNLSKEKY